MKRRIWLVSLLLIFVLAIGSTSVYAVTIGELLGWESTGKDKDDKYESTGKSKDDKYESMELTEDGSYDTKDEVCAYLVQYHRLPSNYMTKKEARLEGWEGGALNRTVSGKCIGGDVFGNYEQLLPEKDGRTYHECDIDTLGESSRGGKRIIYSGDDENEEWNIYYTDDHYETFTLLWGKDDYE